MAKKQMGKKQIHDRQRIQNTIRATEMYALMADISMGILQIISVKCTNSPFMEGLRYQRTSAKERPSEANIM